MAGSVGVELAKRLGIFVVGNLLLWGGGKLIKNKIEGKTLFGKKKDAKPNTYVDWKGNVILGTNDGWVE